MIDISLTSTGSENVTTNVIDITSLEGTNVAISVGRSF